MGQSSKSGPPSIPSLVIQFFTTTLIFATSALATYLVPAPYTPKGLVGLGSLIGGSLFAIGLLSAIHVIFGLYKRAQVIDNDQDRAPTHISIGKNSGSPLSNLSSTGGTVQDPTPSVRSRLSDNAP